jgi:NitT/TauT family transport system permease protein
MKKSISLRGFSAYRIWTQLPSLEISFLPDLLMFAAAITLFYGVLMVGRAWLGPFTPQVDISRSPLALPAYAGYSLLRITIAYVLSLAFTLVYGYIAAYNPRAERFMIPLLDVLQSIPVLSFLPGVMLAMVALFPGRQLGVEAGAILLIFTGQVWNMAFSFYASLKSIPKEMREAAKIYGFSWWQRFIEMELPFAAIGLVWNSMMSVAGGWFFLMACEMFVLGSRDFRLPGLGSYLQTAASAGDTRSILWGVATMVAVIVLLDQFIWRPVIAWAEKFKVEQVESGDAPHSWVLNLFRHSRGLTQLRNRTVQPLGERLMLYFSRHRPTNETEQRSASKVWITRLLAVAVLAGLTYGIVRVVMLLSGLQSAELKEAGLGLGATFLRVNLTLLLGALWTIPAGVAIGFNPKLARIAQPLAQIAASVPATALFPVVLLLLIRLGGDSASDPSRYFSLARSGTSCST